MRILCTLAFLWLGLVSSSFVYASTANCVRLYTTKKYEKAGQCFWKAANQMGDLKRASSIKKYAKGRLLRNAAQSYIKAAKSNPGFKASHFYEQTLKILHQYTVERLYEDNKRKQSLQRRIKKLLKQTGFTTIEVAANHPKAKICLGTGQNKQCHSGAFWNKLIPSGSYPLTVRYPDGTVRQRTVKMEKGLQLSLSFYPPQTHAQITLKSQHPSALLTLSGATLTRQLKHQGGVWKLKLKPGTYQLTLKYPGIPKLRKALVVGVQPQQTFSYQPPSATLQANSVPSGADVYVNGSLRGRTPIQFLVPDGKLEVVFKKGCHTIVRKSVSIQPQEKKTVSGILRPESIYLDWVKSSKAANQNRILGWVGILTGAAVYGLTVGSFIASNQARTEANKARDNYLGSRQQPEQHIPTYQSAAQLNNTWQTIGYISAGVGSASLGLGIFGLVSARTKSLSSLNCQVSMRTNTTLRNSQK